MERAHDAIARRILDLDLRPGVPLDDGALSAELGLSRTPVREALYRLSSEGLVVAGPRGFQVAGIDLLGIRSLFEAQQVLARAVARLLVERATDRDLETLARQVAAVEAAADTGDPSAIARENTELHVLEARLTGNAYLETLAARIHRENQRLAFLSFGGGEHGGRDRAERHELTRVQHTAILAAIRARDADLAERLAAEHVEVFRRRIAGLLDLGTVSLVDLGGLGRPQGARRTP
jgi:DNA-binding GntR family transcriptional regulator